MQARSWVDISVSIFSKAELHQFGPSRHPDSSKHLELVMEKTMSTPHRGAAGTFARQASATDVSMGSVGEPDRRVGDRERSTPPPPQSALAGSRLHLSCRPPSDQRGAARLVW